MDPVTTRRLIHASASLDAPGRALVNLWINRGLDDAELARLTGMPRGRVAARRAQVVDHLATQLGVPKAEITSSLDAFATGATVDADPVRSGARRTEAAASSGAGR